MPLNLPDWLFVLAGFICAFVITLIGIPKVLNLANIKKLYDLPGDRTSHTKPTPRLGGAMIFAGVILSSVLFTGVDSSDQLNYVIAGMLILFSIGIKDDIITLTPLKKIIGQLFASCIIVIMGNVRITDCYSFFGLETLPVILSILFSIFIFMVLINSINLIDGIDGLAAGVGIIAATSFGIWFFLIGHMSLAVICASLLGSLIAFFNYNVFSRKNKIFLGDSGSMLIGFLLAVFAISFLERNADEPDETKLIIAPSLTLAILIVPVFDTLRVIFIRLYKKKSILNADHNHIHHMALSVLKSHIRAAGAILLVNICLIILTILFQSLGNTVLIISLSTVSIILLILLSLFHRHNNI